MTCVSVKEWLDTNFTSSDFMEIDEVQGHLNDCPDCAAYYTELQILHGQLKSIENLTLKAAEEKELHRGIDVSLEYITPLKPAGFYGRWLKPLVRPLAAVVAVLVISLGSWQYQSQKVSVQPIIEQAEINDISSEEALELYLDAELNNLSALISQSSLSYLTDGIPARQAEDILQNISDEEIEWLLDNMNMEI